MPQETNIFSSNTQSQVPVKSQASASSPQPPPPPPPPSPGNGNFFPGILKKIGIIILVLVIGFLLFKVFTGFFGKKNEKVTLTYWGLWEDPSSMKAVISDFERENPNITIVYSKEDIRQYRQRLLTRIQNGNGPDIFRFHNSWTGTILGSLLPLPQDVIGKDDFRKVFYPTALTDLSRNGGIYGIPLEVDDLSLFINTDIFKAASLNPPTTWDEFNQDARQLTVPDSSGNIQTAGAALGAFDNVTHAPDIISLFFLQNGVNFNAFNKSGSQVNDALTYYTSFATGDSKVWDPTLDPSILAFGKGNLAMYFGYSWDVFQLKQINPNLQFQIVDVPHLPGREMTVASYWAEGISSKTKYKKEAFLFLKYLSKKETEQKMFSEISKTRLFGEPYARTDLADLLKDNQFAYPFVRQAPKAQYSYFVSDTFDDGLNSQMNGYLGNAIRSILGNTSIETANETLTAGVLQVLGQSQSQSR